MILLENILIPLPITLNVTVCEVDGGIKAMVVVIIIPILDVVRHPQYPSIWTFNVIPGVVLAMWIANAPLDALLYPPMLQSFLANRSLKIRLWTRVRLIILHRTSTF